MAVVHAVEKQKLESKANQKHYQIKQSKFDQIDWDFLELNEGFRSLGYVPKPQFDGRDYNGVTIGCGVNLRFQDASELRKCGLDEEIVKKLEPFMSRDAIGDTARQLLKQHGGLILRE